MPDRNESAAKAPHECQCCSSDGWAWCDYRGCSECFELEPDPAKKPGWTQAICRGCWNERNPERPVTNAPTIYVGDVCCYCGESANTGLYIRVDPSTVPHPQVFANE